MAEFPGPSETISKVLLSILPPKTYTYLSAFLPGLFFEVSIFLANPHFIEQLNLRANQAAQIGKYPKICIALFLGFVIGHALMLWVSFVHRVLGVLYRVSRFLWHGFCAWPLLPAVNKVISGKNWLSRSPWMVTRVLRPVEESAFGVDNARSEGVRRLWARLAHHLLGKQYGLETIEHLMQEEWNALYDAFGSIPIIPLGHHMLMVAFRRSDGGAY
jgi:hypothetical protein